LLTYSSAIAFQVLYAVVPLALLALAGLSLVGEQSVYTGHIAPTLKDHLSKDAFGIANRTALKVMTSRAFFWATLGSLLSAVCWFAATVGFGAYISTVSYSSVYGGLGSVILLLIYLHVSAIAFLLGVSVDSQLRAQERRTPRRGRARTPVGT
jgi:uncharacterized BrkB/YihY/UPF0761 family membrane protein